MPTKQKPTSDGGAFRVTAGELLAPVDSVASLEAAIRVLDSEIAQFKRTYADQWHTMPEYFELVSGRLHAALAQTLVRLARLRT